MSERILNELDKTLNRLKDEGVITEEWYEKLKEKIREAVEEDISSLEVEEKLDKYSSFGAFMDDVNEILIREHVPKFSYEIYRKFAKEVWNSKEDEEKVEEIVEKYSEIVPSEDVLDEILDLLYGEGEEGGEEEWDFLD